MLSSVRDRNWGGTSASVSCEPYLSGFHFTKWYLPKKLSVYLSKNLATPTNGESDSASDSKTAEDMLSAACISFTPPGQNVNFIEYMGTCGIKWNRPTQVEYGNSVQVKFLEMTGIPIFRIHSAWVNMIRENKSGYKTGTEPGVWDYHQTHYAANLLYWTTKPDGITVEFAAAYSGVMPSRDAQEAFSSDVANVDKVEFDMEYRIDRIWNEKWVYDLAKSESKKSPFGSKGNTLWSREGFRYQNQSPSSFNETPSKL